MASGGSAHSTVMYEHAVAASALYNELGMAEAYEALGPASEPRTVTPGRRPVMDVAGVPHELIRWTSRRSDQIAACPAEGGPRPGRRRGRRRPWRRCRRRRGALPPTRSPPADAADKSAP
ncbi:relaxase domain-containing protein [Streptomyces lavenduligriseus]|uniref:relaxase domain-containing protein n=1 Tax=Streptomyces lavenduligriseus TaxID=67315 RepID=UPI0024B674C1|nr:relaxase domain-containing protein [Streptomyces lavenduligriseus]